MCKRWNSNKGPLFCWYYLLCVCVYLSQARNFIWQGHLNVAICMSVLFCWMLSL